MTSPFAIRDVRFSAASQDDMRRGLLGYVALTAGAFQLDGIAVRRERSGRVSLSFPKRRDGRGRQHALIRPLDDAVRREIEREVLAVLDGSCGTVSPRAGFTRPRGPASCGGNREAHKGRGGKP